MLTNKLILVNVMLYRFNADRGGFTNKSKRLDITSFYKTAGPAFPPTRVQSEESQNEFFLGQDLESNTFFPTS